MDTGFRWINCTRDELEDSGGSDQSFNIIGNLLQSIGNSLQAISGIYEMENDRVAHSGKSYMKMLNH